MEFDLGADGSLTPLPKQNIDTGMGLERAAMLLQGVDSIFDTDGFRLIMDWIAAESGVAYGTSQEATKAHRVLCDHGRGVTFLVAEGVTPSNEGRGYVLRRLIRRSVVQARRIGLPAVYPLPRIVVEQVGPWYPEVVENAAEIERVVQAEEERFRETLDRGMKEFEDLAGGDIGADDAFRLAATYGFPIELTVELARERGHAVDVDGYRREMEQHREISRGTGEKGLGQRAAEFAREAGFATEFVGYAKTDVLTQLGALEDLGDGTFLAKLRESPFYPAGGGPGDRPRLDRARRGPTTRAELVDAFRFDADQALLFRGAGFTAGDRVRAVVPWSVRFPTMANHTATHLLQAALREVARRPRHAGGLRRPARQAPLRLHPHGPAGGRRARGDRAARQPGDLRERAGAHVRDDARRGTPARSDGALRREVRRGRARGRGARHVDRAVRRHARPLDGRDRRVRDPRRGLGREGRAPHRGGHLG